MEPIPPEVNVPDESEGVPQFPDWYPEWDEDEGYFSAA